MKRRLPPLLGATEPQPADAIAVLGCTLRPDGAPGRALTERIETGRILYRRGLAPLILVTGGRRWHGRVEADVMKERLVEAEVPPEAILREGRSRSTRENARLGGALLLERGARSVLIVTQPLHLRRAVRAFSAAGLEARGHLIEGSYQLQKRELASAGRDLIREVAATTLDLATLALRRPYP